METLTLREPILRVTVAGVTAISVPLGVKVTPTVDATFTPLVSPPPASIVATNWTMGAAFQFIPAYPSTRTKIRVTVNNPAPYTNVYDLSDQYFTTAGMLILAPTSNDIYNIGAMYQVRWVSAGAGDVDGAAFGASQDFFTGPTPPPACL